MKSILDIAAKDLLQLLRDRKTFMFLLLMPLVFTFLFGFAFGGFGGGSDARLPVAFLDQDDHPLTHKLGSLLADSQVLRLVDYTGSHPEELEALVGEGKLAAAIIVPRGYGHELLFGRKARLALIADTATTAGMSVESEVLSRIIRLEGAVRAALLLEKTLSRKAPFNYTLQQALSRWQDPPIQVVEIPSAALKDLTASQEALSHTSPGMMLQFAIAGLLTCAQVLVAERRSRALQRLFTTAVPRLHILLGHTLAIYLLIICQFCLLMLFGQFALGVRYLNAPLAALLLALSAAACIACLGMLIGVLARSEDQAVVFSLVPMFVFAGLGGVWVPLEVAGPVFQMVGHASPLAWAMDGFNNILLRGQGFGSVLVPSAALWGYALLFFSLAAWRFWRMQES